eukprot:scaffold558932_cov18-Prasinocladus_malaysianus.AAC.1
MPLDGACQGRPWVNPSVWDVWHMKGSFKSPSFASADGKGVFVAWKDMYRAVILRHARHGARAPIPERPFC